MRSNPRRAQRLPFRLMFSTLGAVGLTACGTVTPQAQLNIPSLLREHCPLANKVGVTSIGDLGSFSVRQDEATINCDARRAAVVEMIDKAQEKPKRKWWRFGKPDDG